MLRKNLTPEMAWPKIRQYCDYQERSHQEVKQRLYSYGLRKTDVEEIISRLISDNYLNEERFATSFARGKFRIKQWGKVKIKLALREKQVSSYNIIQALDALDQEEYEATLRKLATRKWKILEAKGGYTGVRKAQLYQWLLSRGYESPLVARITAMVVSGDE